MGLASERVIVIPIIVVSVIRSAKDDWRTGHTSLLDNAWEHQ